jgi:hypothetical protein
MFLNNEKLDFSDTSMIKVGESFLCMENMELSRM